MKKARLITAMTATIPAAVGGFAPPAVAHTTRATTAQAQQRPATGKTVVHHGGIQPDYGQWWPLSHSDTLYFRSGGSTVLPDQDQVFITCYYSGTNYLGDKYWDHIIRYLEGRFEVSKTGHLRDRWVHLPNAEYPPAAGIPHC
jgi:hypothetical protein